MVSADTHEVLTRVDGHVGILTLNRPRAINSLTHGMVTAVDSALAAWASDETVDAVVVNGAGERGLCAGGDVVALYHSAKAGGAEARAFFFDEYRLDSRIGHYPKPYVALMDGIVMGGGVGISGHGNVRVVTESSKIAMPEVGIGFIPDVGGTYLLSRAPGLLGLHAALTGAPFGAGDAIAMGFADHFVPREKLELFTATVVADGAEGAVAAHAVEPPPSPLAAQRDWIDQCYAGETVSEILAALRGYGEEPAGHPAARAAALIETRSPIALAVTLAAVRRAAALPSLDDVLVQEYRVSCASLRSHDFVEGIRAQLVDKDRNPQWSPSSSAAVTEADVEGYFAPADPDLTFDKENS